MLIESALVLFGVIETLNQAFLRLSSGMSRGKGCLLSGGSTSVVTTGSEGREVEGTGSPVGFGLGAAASMACGEVLISVNQGMAVDWLVPDVEAGAAVLRKGSCSIDGKDSADGSTRLRWSPCFAKSARVSCGLQSRVSW
jgi:hypothetical protein